jgi:cold shock protein
VFLGEGVMSSRVEVTGTVQVWHSEEGWGVLVSPEMEGIAFAHFSAVDATGFRDLQPGERVLFRYGTPGQDGCDHRASYVKSLD